MKQDFGGECLAGARLAEDQDGVPILDLREQVFPIGRLHIIVEFGELANSLMRFDDRLQLSSGPAVGALAPHPTARPGAQRRQAFLPPCSRDTQRIGQEITNAQPHPIRLVIRQNGDPAERVGRKKFRGGRGQLGLGRPYAGDMGAQTLGLTVQCRAGD